MWRRRKCQSLGLRYHGSNGVTPGGPDTCLTTPVSIKRIIGDGNCFYRSIAFAITGSQRQHLAVRQAIVDHMLVVGDVLTGNSSIGIEEYITNNSVERPGTWATENEIYAVCHLLRIDLHVYSDVQGDWLKIHHVPWTPHWILETFQTCRSISTTHIVTMKCFSLYPPALGVVPTMPKQ